MGGHEKEQLLKTNGRRSSLKDKQRRGFTQHDLFCPSSPSLNYLTKVKNDLLAENHETISGT